ncbi:MAG: glycosyltransferase family 4 protein [Planctomycetota bacterium]
MIAPPSGALRVLYLVQNPKSPSARFRAVEMAPQLLSFGVASEVRAIGRHGAERKAVFREAAAYDVVVLARRLLTGRDLRQLRRAARVLIYEFDDAVMYRDPRRGRPKSLVRRLRFRNAVRSADAIIAGNHILAEEARRYCEAPVFVVPTAVDTQRYRATRGDRHPEVSVGWLGSRGSVWYFDRFADVWERVSEEMGDSVRFRVVCDVPPTWRSALLDYIPWSPEAELAALSSFDVGLMPLTDDPFSRGKCACKILQYFAAGLPVVASPVGMNREVVTPGVTGFLAEEPEQWAEYVGRLATDHTLREKLGAAGRELVARDYDVRIVARRLAQILKGRGSSENETT